MPYLTREARQPEPIDCRILTAALELFADNGYHAVSIHEIQKRADVSIGSIYKHFGGKEGIANALFTHIMREIELVIEQVLNTHSNVEDQCEAIITRLLGYTETHPNIIAYAFYAKHSEFLPEQPSLCDTAPFHKMREIVQNGIKQGVLIDVDPWVATASVFGTMARLIQLRLDGSLSTPLPKLTNDLLQTIWNGVSATQTVNAKARNVKPASLASC